MPTMLTEADQERLREAVAAAEQRTSGEIVPYVVARSGRYDAAVWRGASFLAIAATGVAMLILQFYDGWGLGWLFTGWGIALVALLAGTAGALLAAYVPPLQRLLAGDDLIALTVHQRAMQAFVEEEVFNTRERTGILLFVSLAEHRIEVFGDTGINQKVSPDDWAEVVERVRAGIKEGRFAEGLIAGIGLCGELLERSGVERRPDDVDELPNKVRIRRKD